MYSYETIDICAHINEKEKTLGGIAQCDIAFFQFFIFPFCRMYLSTVLLLRTRYVYNVRTSTISIVRYCNVVFHSTVRLEKCICSRTRNIVRKLRAHSALSAATYRRNSVSRFLLFATLFNLRIGS